MVIKIKYFNRNLEKIKKISKGDWIDLRASETIYLNKGECASIPLGVAMQLPKNYEAHILPRSSTWKNFRIIQTNHMGIIDESYCGDNDQWLLSVYALENTHIKENDRICQFRIVEKMPEFDFEEVEQLDNDDRGGFGSSGVR